MIEHNIFADLIYKKPKGKIKEWFYYRKEIKPVMKKIEKGPVPFEYMVQFSDFIKILEMAFFYHNDIKYIEEIDFPIRIISDNNIKNNSCEDQKNLTILDEIHKVTIIFKLREEFIDEYNSYQYIDIICRNEFGKKITTNFNIRNAEVLNEEINSHTHNLLYNINYLLSKCMVELFMKYYKIS